MKIKFVYVLLVLILSAKSMHAQEKKAGKIVSDYFALLDAGNLDAVGNLLTDDFQAIAPFSPKPFVKTAWKAVGQTLKAAYPDMKHAITYWFADDNWVAVRGEFTGTNKGAMFGQAATNNKVRVPITVLFELNGKGYIKSLTTQFDQKLLEEQLMSGNANPKMNAEKTVRELFAMMDAGNSNQFSNYCSADFKIMNPFVTEPSPIQAFQGILVTQKTAFPDMKHEITELITDGKYVTTKGIFKGTNTGSMMGNPPTGNKVNLPFLVLDELDAMGKIKNRFVQFDGKSFDAQIMAGINPNTAKEKIILELMKAADAGDIAKFESFWDRQGKSYFGNQENNLEETKQRILAFKTGIPDVHRVVDEILVSGNQLVVHGTLTGTHTGKFMGKPATNNPIKIGWLAVYKLNESNKIESGRVEFDSAAFNEQLQKQKIKSKK
ncbi:MAG: ester cyclase [Saprospiraceae bacterium]|nr:ester cyclase [Saprospiraceae bacterium]